MNVFLAHLESIASTDWATIAVISTLCAIAAYFVKEYLAQPPMIIFVFPVMVFCGLVAEHVFVYTEQFSPKKLDQWLMWTILASIFGTVVGIGGICLMASLREKIGGAAPPPVKAVRHR